jgi:photosystem II stability/assembly factor-like uncharacterized protein
MIKYFLFFLFFTSCLTISQERWIKLNGPHGATITGLYAKGDTLLVGTGHQKGLIFFSTDKGNSWDKANIKVTPRFQDFVYSKQTNEFFAIAHYSGIYKSTTLRDWIEVFNTDEQFWSLGEDHIGNLYAGTQNGKIYFSGNGINWSLSIGNFGVRIEKFFLASDNALYASLQNKILRKDANSTTWLQFPIPSIQQNYQVFGEYTGDVYVNGISFIKRSSNRGETWENLDTNEFFSGNYAYNMLFNGNRIIAGFSDQTGFFGNGWGIAVSDDLGYTWRWSNTGLPPRLAGVYKLTKSGDDTFIGPRAAGVFKSTNFGDSWFPVNNGITAANTLDICFDSEGTIYAASWSNYLQKSTDKGLTWQSLPNGFEQSYFYTVIADDNDNLLAGTDEGVYRSTNKGESWTRTALLGSNNFSYRLFKDSTNRIYSLNYAAGIYRTTDLGNNWVRIDNGFSHSGFFSFTIDSNNQIYAGTRGGAIYKSNNGTNWVKIYQSNIQNSVVGGIAIAPNGYIFANNNYEGTLRSTDAGVTWIKVKTDIERQSYSPIEITNTGTIYISGSGDKLFKSTDNGDSWEDVSLNLVEVRKIIFDKNDDIYLATDESVWRSNPDFIPVELSTFTASVTENSVNLKWTTSTELNNKGFEISRSTGKDEWISLSFIPGSGTTTEPKEYTYTDNNLNPGIYKYKLIQIDYDGTRKEEKEIEVEVSNLPTEYALFQNYPNPFNPTTTIKYSVKEAGIVSLKVYDILGKEITTLVNETKSPGEYSVQYDGAKLSSGVYFYTMRAGGYVDTRKFMLMK